MEYILYSVDRKNLSKDICRSRVLCVRDNQGEKSRYKFMATRHPFLDFMGQLFKGRKYTRYLIKYARRGRIKWIKFTNSVGRGFVLVPKFPSNTVPNPI
jgi:hypothetical protein